MRSRRGAGARPLATAALLALALGSAAARAAACADPRDAAGGPLPGGADGADFGAIPEACAGTDLTLRLRGAVLVASQMPDYYGNVAGTGTLRLRHGLGRESRAWLTVAADVTTYRYVANAVIRSGEVSFGPLTLGLHRAAGAWDEGAAAVYARALLPVDTARANGARMGLEVGATGRRALGAGGRFGVQGGAALLAPLVVVAGQTHLSLEPVALAEAWWAPRPHAALFAGLGTRDVVSPDATLVSVVPRLGARLATGGGFSFSALAEAPVGGSDRTNVVLGLFAGWAAPPPPSPSGAL